VPEISEPSTKSNTPLSEHLKLLELLLQKKGINISSPRAIPRRTNFGPTPLSFAQFRLWFLEQMEPGNPFYNITIALRLRGKLNITALERTVNEIVRRHEVLRTSFRVVGGEAVQVIKAEEKLGLPLIDVSGLSEAEQAEAVRAGVREQAQQGFDLSRGPLLRVKLWRLSETEHVLVCVLHHIISDGWSLSVLVKEVAALYEAYSEGRESGLAELSIQYADYVVWQREWLQGEVLAGELGYWREQLAGAPPVLELATDYARPAVQTFAGGRERLSLGSGLGAGLRELSQEAGVTLFMTLLSAFAVLLTRYSGQEDVVIGTPIAGRTRGETEQLIGFFVNTLALRVAVRGDESFKELLGRVREVCLGAYEHQEVPFEKLVEELRPERSLSHTPLFQVMLNLLNLDYVNKPIELPGLTVEIITSIEAPTSKFDLTLYAIERDAKLELELAYNSDLFEKARMVEMLGQLHQLLSQIVAGPDQAIDQYSLVTGGAKDLLPNPAQELNRRWEGAIQKRFSEQARRNPQRTALVDNDDAWSYEKLELLSNQLANYLLAHGLKSQQTVAVYGHRSIPLVWALLGVMKAGAAFIILDPTQPGPRLVDCLRVAQPQAWLQLEAAGIVPDVLEEFVSRIPCQTLLPKNVATPAANPFKEYPSDDPALGCDPDGLAYVVFTSGSTGKAKGIMGTQRPLSHFLRWSSERFGLDETDRFSMLSGLSHDPLLRDIFLPLWLGSTLCIPSPEETRDSLLLSEWLKRERISVAHLTPGLGRILMETRAGTKLAALRYLFFGGDLLRKQDISRLRVLIPSASFVNFYGAAETPQAVGYFVVPDQLNTHEAGAASSKEAISIGRGIADVQLLVLNNRGQLAGIGELGEINIRTPYLAVGYLGQADLTRKQFGVNPFTGRDDDRLYHTGDLGRYGADGSIQFVGRRDRQVKVRGFRVELEEIEAALAKHPAVREIVVETCSDLTGDNSLTAYVVPTHKEALSISELQIFAIERLPEYMIPSAMVELESLPLTPNGKVDRGALPAPQPGVVSDYVAARSESEKLLTEIWAHALRLERVGVHDNFFELGGHSLLATQVLSRVREAFQVEIPLRQLFEKPTIAHLALIVKQKQDEQGDKRNLVITRVSEDKENQLLKNLDHLSDEEVGSLLDHLVASAERIE
jgi:amino acid adenylation domain-containing protein